MIHVPNSTKSFEVSFITCFSRRLITQIQTQLIFQGFLPNVYIAHRETECVLKKKWPLETSFTVD